jgi:hypothetical protein
MLPDLCLTENAMSRCIARVTALFLVLGVICSCRSNKVQSLERESAKKSDSDIRDAIFPLSKGSSPTEVFTTSTLSLLVKTGDITPTDRFQRSIYLWEPGKEPKLIVSGHFLDVVRLSDDDFAASWYSRNSEDSPVAFITLNVNGHISQRLMLPPSGPTGWGGCEGDTRYVVCIGNLPKMKADDKNYDEMGFSAVLVIDLKQQKTSWFPVKHETYFHFDPARERIYVSDDQPNLSSRVQSFDLAGNAREEAHVLDMTRSPSGHFADSLQEDGADSWEVYDTASKRALLTFGCDKPGCKVGDHQDGHLWNPVFDGQFVALETGGAYGRGGTCDVYQASRSLLVKSVPCDGLPVIDWSRDGRELITIKYEGGEYRRELINQSMQNRSPIK